MLISGLNRLSLIDYPGHIACVVFTLGCNFRCGYCHNPDFVLPERIAKLKVSHESEKDFFDFLTQRHGLLEGVSICGGEPTIHQDLGTFCMKIKNLGFKVKLDTNGSRPDVIRELLDKNLVDYIAMDIKHSWDKYETIIGVDADITSYQESVSLIKSSAKAYEFRTTIIEGIHTTEDIDGLGEIVRGAQHYVLQQYRTGDNLDPNFGGITPNYSLLEAWKKRLTPTYLENVEIRL